MGKEFTTTLSKIEPSKKIEIKAFIKSFRSKVFNSIIELEPIEDALDKRFKLYKFKTYSILIIFEEQTNTYIFQWIGKHNDVSKYVRNKIIEIIDNSVQIYEIKPYVLSKAATKLFNNFSYEQLLKLGIPKNQLEMIKNINDKIDFYNLKDSFSEETYECLNFLLEGIPYDKLVSNINDKSNSNILIDKKILENSRSFYVVKGQEDLINVLNAPLEKWRVFLHPEQKKLVDKDFDGPVYVSGGAGTGKTVVAMHRAKYLLNKNENYNVLFTTFTNNLKKDIEENLKKIIDFEQIKRLDVFSVDSIILKYFKKKKPDYKIVYDDNYLLSLWDKAIENARVTLDFSSEFYFDEWRKIATTLDDLIYEKYLTMSRPERGTRLERNQRIDIWKVFEEYMSILNQNKERDIDFATYEARAFLKNEEDFLYNCIIIDEGQDISTNSFKFLRAYMGKEHKNDMFIVGDSCQRIYDNKTELSRCGINVIDRCFTLDINYRTTEETRKFAYGLIEDVDFKNLDGTEINSKCLSLTHGEKPFVKNFEKYNEQSEFLVKEINKLVANGANFNDICIVARTENSINVIKNTLNEKNIRNFQITKENNSNENDNSVKLATMHRVKGLEFRYVFVISVNNGIMPMKNLNLDDFDKKDNESVEKSLLYVALTRAQIKAYVLSFGKQSYLIDRKSNLFNVELNNEFDKYIAESISSNDFVKLDKVNNKQIFEINEEKLDILISDKQDNFQDLLYKYLEEKNMTDAELERKIGMDRKHYYKIKNRVVKQPNKKDIIRLCFGLELDIIQTNDFLARVNYALNPENKFDKLVKFLIENSYYDYEDANHFLFKKTGEGFDDSVKLEKE